MPQCTGPLGGIMQLSLQRVCMWWKGGPLISQALDDRFTSHTCHPAHQSRSESPRIMRDVKSEESLASHACNKPNVD